MKRLLAIVLTLVAASAALTSPVAAAASCTAQFTSALAPLGAFGQLVVKPEVFSLNLGGPNLGQEVKILFATADRDACPVVPMP